MAASCATASDDSSFMTGAWLIVERAANLDRQPASFPNAVGRRAITLVLVMVGWVFFRSPNLEVAGEMLGAMFSPAGLVITDLVDAALTRQREITLLLASLVALLPGWLVVGRLLDDTDPERRAAPATRAVATGGLGALAALTVAAGSFSPFLYFQF